MSENGESFNVFDPTGMLKTMRDTGLENWSKMMAGLVHGDAFAEANGAMLDALLSSSAPFRKSLETVMAQTLANLSLPSREEVARLAERMTNIEMKLDDMDSKLDQLLQLNWEEKS
jgi:ubiquinone biosynthesis protein UbiJ